MGMYFSVYIGPYITVKRDSGFDWYPWEKFVCDGRCELGFGEKDWILIPNCPLGGITRLMHFDSDHKMQLEQINPAMIVQESSAFSRLAIDVISYLDDQDIDYVQAWGVVPCEE